MSNNYQRKFRSQRRHEEQNVPSRRRKKRTHRSLFSIFLMLVGAATLFVLLMRYVIVPVLVMLPQWLGGAGS